MFPQYGPQAGPQVGNGYTSSAILSQNTSLLGNQPSLPQNQAPDLNTTAPMSSAQHPAIQNMISALNKGGK